MISHLLQAQTRNYQKVAELISRSMYSIFNPMLDSVQYKYKAMFFPIVSLSTRNLNNSICSAFLVLVDVGTLPTNCNSFPSLV